MLNARFVKIATYSLVVLTLLSAGTAYYLKGYIIDNQGTWNGRQDLIKIVVFLGGDLAPRVIAYLYYASCVSCLAVVTLLSLLKKK
jgi:hypothetical protein